MTIDLPDRNHITHDGCSAIIEAWRSGRLIDREAIDYQAARDLYADDWGITMYEIRKIVDAALADKETTT